ncbi:MAG: type II secretion system F family protein [Candidatus Syntropharchaeia archaeon]
MKLNNRIWKDVYWGNTVYEALLKLEYRLRIGALSRTITLIIDASRATRNIRETLSIATVNAEKMQQLKRMRKANMSVYVIIIYITFAVFLFTIYVLCAKFLSFIPETSVLTSSGLLSERTPMEDYIYTLFHASLIQGFFSGMVAGEMSRGTGL